MKEWTAQANSPEEASMFKRMNGRPQLPFSNKMTRNFTKWANPSSLTLAGPKDFNPTCVFFFYTLFWASGTMTGNEAARELA